MYLRCIHKNILKIKVLICLRCWRSDFGKWGKPIECFVRRFLTPPNDRSTFLNFEGEDIFVPQQWWKLKILALKLYILESVSFYFAVNFKALVNSVKGKAQPSGLLILVHSFQLQNLLIMMGLLSYHMAVKVFESKLGKVVVLVYKL